MRFPFWILWCAVLLCGCSSVYHSYQGSSGYIDAPLQRDVYQVTYVGLPRHLATQVQSWATLRCAELTVEKGGRHFEVLDTKVERKVTTRLIAAQTTVERTVDDKKEKQKEKREEAPKKEVVIISSTPAHEVKEENVIVTIVMRILASPSTQSFDAINLLIDGKKQGFKFSAEVEALLSPQR